MHILVINPNSTASMTRAIGDAARAAARQGTRITAINPPDTPPAIQGAEDGAAALPSLFELFEREVIAKGGYDACIIACFDDLGLMELKQISPIPVVGIGEASYLAGMLLGRRFSVVTTLEASVPVIKENVTRYGEALRCVGVRASQVAVLELDNDAALAHRRISSQIREAVTQEQAQSVALGCAGMGPLAARLSGEFQMPVIDGIEIAVAFVEALHQTAMRGLAGTPARQATA